MLLQWLDVLHAPEETSRQPEEECRGSVRSDCHTGSHHRLHVQDPQGLRDLDAGVHLPIHAHQEGPVQQYSRVLCAGDRTGHVWPR